MSRIVAIFAHPDDEAFGPGGTLAKLSRDNEIYLICVTSGGACKNGGHIDSIAQQREKELKESSKILGIRKVFFLRYTDGSLCNNIYHTAAEEIRSILDELQPQRLITFEMRGVSGHIDHVFVSMVCSFLFNQLSYAKEIWYYCHNKDYRKVLTGYFIYVPPGYEDSEITETIDVKEVWDVKVKAMYCHESQKEDADRILGRYEKLPKVEHFIVMKK